MCRNITELRGLQPPATEDEVFAAAMQYVRKISGLRASKNPAVVAAMNEAAHDIAHITRHLLEHVPERRQPPKVDPPLRRPAVRERLGLEPFEFTSA